MSATDWFKCRCLRPDHATSRGFVRCEIRHARWITGDGRWALVSWCNAPTITLWPTQTEALDAHNLLHAIRCGSRCRSAHAIVHIQTNQETHA